MIRKIKTEPTTKQRRRLARSQTYPTTNTQTLLTTTPATATSATTASTTTPCEKAMNTYELLDAILRFLPFRDLLLSRRVCQQSKLVIGRPLQLQQMLYLAPIEAAPEAPGVPHPLKYLTFGGLEEVKKERCKVHPRNRAITRVLEQEESKVYAAFILERVKGKTVNASFMFMYASQPPMRQMSLYLWSPPDEGLTLSYTTVGNENGVTFGDLLRKVQAEAVKHPGWYRGALIWLGPNDYNVYSEEDRARKCIPMN